MPADRTFFDSNVLLYTLERDTRRQRIAEDLIDSGGVIVSVQSLNEFVSVAHRKLKLDWTVIRQARDTLIDLCELVVPLTIDIHRSGVDLAQRHRLSVYDGMIVAAALSAGCSVLYSEDMHAGLVVEDRLTITNPF